MSTMGDDAITANRTSEQMHVDDLVQTLVQAGCTPEQVQAFIRSLWKKYAGGMCWGDYAE